VRAASIAEASLGIDFEATYQPPEYDDRSAILAITCRGPNVWVVEVTVEGVVKDKSANDYRSSRPS
jgi:hypothetical protein